MYICEYLFDVFFRFEQNLFKDTYQGYKTSCGSEFLQVLLGIYQVTFEKKTRLFQVLQVVTS